MRGFDPFMNMVIDESVEICKDERQNNIGMVVSKNHTYYPIVLIEKIFFHFSGHSG